MSICIAKRHRVKNKSFIIKLIVLVVALVMLGGLVACSEVTEEDNYPFTVIDTPANQVNIDTTTKDEAVEMTSQSIKNLKEYLKSVTVSDVGYYMNFDFKINTENGSNFRLRFEANLYAYPYSDYEEGSAEYQAALAIHNRVIKKSDILLEWYDGQSNELLIGFYFDGENASALNPGNNLYLNLQGEKRYYENFGDTVIFQQFIRLITQIDIDTILASNDSSMDESIDTLAFYLGVAITNNYKLTLNGDTTSIYYDTVSLNVIIEDINDILSAIFSPFDNKIDPLTNKYLRFKFSTLANTDITSLNADMRFLSQPDTEGSKLIMTGFEGEFDGTALTDGVTVPFTSTASLGYSTRISSDIEMDLNGYTKFEHGQYEFVGELYIPFLKNNNTEGTTYDLHIYTSLNEYDNKTNRIDARFYDKATQQPMLMFFYQNELLYINTEGISEQFGGPIELEDIGFPKVYLEDIDVASIMKWFYDTVNNGVVSIVDTLLDPNTYLGEPEPGLIDAIMKKMVSTDDTMTLTVDHELIKDVLKYTSEVDPNAEVPLGKDGQPIYSLDEEGRPLYTTYGLVYVLEEAIGYNLDEIASILGIQSAEKLIEYTWFEVSYNVDTGEIKVEMYSSVRKARSLIFRLTMYCVVFGQTVEFPDDAGGFEYYKKLGEVKTLSGTISGTVKFSGQEPVNLSPLLGTMIGDKSGLNTVYYADSTATVDFFLIMDQYIQWSEDDENLNAVLGSIVNEGVNVDYADIANETRGRMAFYSTFIVRNLDGHQDLVAKLYAYNVSFNEETYKKIEAGETLEGYGYVYVDLSGGVRPTLTEIPLVKIREDVFLESLSTYLGTNQAIENASTLSVVSIISALMEDAVTIFTKDYIGITTSNLTVQRLFGVDDLVANFKANVGLKSRVIGQYNLYKAKVTDEYADYEVGELADLTVSSIYDSENPIHKTIEVTYTWLDGSQKVLDMFFEYYRRTEPDRNDYADDETYQVDYDEYIAYINSPNNLTLVDRKTEYIPKIDGPFMGVEREYTITIYNPGNALMATSIISDLVSYEYEWEPLEAKPTTVLCEHTNGTASYSANFLIDWEMVTIDGIPAKYYEVIVGEGSLGEFRKTVRITVLNRRIVNSDGSKAETVFVLDKGYFDEGKIYSSNSNTLVAKGIISAEGSRYYVNEGLITADNRIDAVASGSAVIAREIVIDGKKYYALTKDIVIDDTIIYVEDGIAYVDSNHSVLLSNVNIAVEKAASVAATYQLDPYEYIIARYNNATYRNTDNYYISIFLRTTRFTLYFASGSSYTGSFEWSFDEPGGMNVERGISDAGGIIYVHTVFKNQTIALKINISKMDVESIQNIGEEDVNTYTVDVLDTNTWTMPTRPTVNFENGSSRQFPFSLKWSATYASNVSLNGANTIDSGEVDEYGIPIEIECPFPNYVGNEISAYIDIFASLGIGEWFSPKIVTMKVLVPKKELKVYNTAEVYTTSAESGSTTINIVDIVIKGGSRDTAGYWFVDPRYVDTMTLSNIVTCYFQEEGGKESHKDYAVEWDTSTGIVSKNVDNANYSIFDNILANTSVSRMYELKSSIGEGDAKYEFSIAIVLLPQNPSKVVFVDTIAGGEIEMVTNTSYNYKVDVFGSTFAVPTMLRFEYATDVIIGQELEGGASIVFYPEYEIVPTHPDENLLYYTYRIGDIGNAVEINLNVVANQYDVTDVSLIVDNLEIAGIGIDIQIETNKIVVEGLNVDNQGMINYTYNSQAKTMGIMEFIEWLLTADTTVTYTTAKADDAEMPSKYAELVDFRRNFTSQSLTTTGTGLTVTLRLSSVPGVLDFAVTLKGSIQRTVTGEGVNQSKKVTLYQYGANGSELYPDINGYALSQVKTTVSITEGGKTTTMTYSNLDWYVDYTTGEEIAGSYVKNTLVTHISRATLYGKHRTSQSITLYSHLPDGTRVMLEVEIPAIDWTKFNSIEYTGDFSIVNGVVTVENMFDVDISTLENIIAKLPTTIRFYNLVAEDVQWMVKESARDILSKLDYSKGQAEFVLATAVVDVVGELPIELKFKFDACTFAATNSVEVDTIQGVTSTFDIGTNTLNLVIMPYLTNVNGSYILDRSLTLNFEGEKSTVISDAVYYVGEDILSNYTLPFTYASFNDGTNQKTFEIKVGFGLNITVVVDLVNNTIPDGATVEVEGQNTTLSKVEFGTVYDKETIVIGGVEYIASDSRYLYTGTGEGSFDYALGIVNIGGSSYTFDSEKIYMANGEVFGNIDVETGTIETAGAMYVFEYDKIYAVQGSIVQDTVNLGSEVYTIDGNDLVKDDMVVGSYYEKGYYSLDILEGYKSVKLIDPFAKRAVIDGVAYHLPTLVAVEFVAGSGIYTTVEVEWDISSLVVTYEGGPNIIINGIIRQSGLSPQAVKICVGVERRDVSEITLFDQENMGLIKAEEGTLGNFTMYVSDTFEFDASSLPKYAIVKENGVESLVPLSFITSAVNFPVAGGAHEIVGDLATDGVGQPISIAVVADTYTFVSIWRPTSMTDDSGRITDDYTKWEYNSLMSPVAFTFVGQQNENGDYNLGYRAYKVVFRATSLEPGQDFGKTREIVKWFVPSIYAESGENILYFDNAAVEQAASEHRDVSASFYLGMEGKASMTVSNAIYRVTDPVLYEDGMSFVYDTADGVEESPYLLIDPLNIDIAQYAYLYTNWSELERLKFRVSDYSTFDTIKPDNYIGGGLLLGRSLTFTLVDEYDNDVIINGNPVTRNVRVKILFIDRTLKTAILSNRDVRDDGYTYDSYNVTMIERFTKDTYTGKAPYTGYFAEDSDIISALNLAIRKYGYTATIIARYGQKGFVSFTVSGFDRIYQKDILAGVLNP